MYRKQKQDKTTKEQSTTPVQTFLLFLFVLVLYLFTFMFDLMLYFVLLLF
jgi:hypothetical protein